MGFWLKQVTESTCFVVILCKLIRPTIPTIVMCTCGVNRAKVANDCIAPSILCAGAIRALSRARGSRYLPTGPMNVA